MCANYVIKLIAALTTKAIQPLKGCQYMHNIIIYVYHNIISNIAFS